MKKLLSSTLLLLAMSAQASDISDVPDYAPLQDLVVDTSIFLIHDFSAPADYNGETLKLQGGAPRRIDYYVEGKRVVRSEIPVGSIYCSVVSSGERGGFTERSKRFSISSISEALPAPRPGERGVGIRLKSVTNSTIQAVSCYQAESAVVPLTVRILRYMVRTTDDGTSLSLLAPPTGAAVASNESDSSRAPAGKDESMADTHRRFVNYVKQATPNAAQNAQPANQ